MELGRLGRWNGLIRCLTRDLSRTPVPCLVVLPRIMIFFMVRKITLTRVNFFAKFFNNSQNDVRSILDIGCGTASHGVQLSLRGYDVTGFDLSHEMIALAHKKVQDAGASMTLHTMNMIDFTFDRSFDSAICMFAVLGYVTKTHDLISALRNIRQHLPEGALFVFDVWNGLAVCHEMPSERMKTVTSGDIRVRRFIRPELDVVNHVCHNYYNLVVTRDDQIVQETEEVHTMRFFFPQELDYYWI